MDVLSGRAVVIVLSESEASVFARQQAQTLQLAYGVRGQHPPRLLDDISRAVSSAAGFRDSAQVGAGGGTGGFRDGPGMPLSDQPVRLTVKEAAQLAEVSEGFMRRLCRRGDVQASQGSRGAWAVDIASLAAWISQRRREHERKVA